MSKQIEWRFPFGQPVLSRPPSAKVAKPLFILGAYPSALHVAWRPPRPYAPIRAMAVENEPEPFWTGAGERERIEKWKKAVEWDESRFGTVSPVGLLNGASGEWVESKVLRPLRTDRGDAWITDCLDTYRPSEGLRERLKDTYAPFAKAHKLPTSQLPDHPSEDEIVDEAHEERDRLLRELLTAKSARIVTLGSAALRVLTDLVEVRGEVPEALSAEPGAYGLVREVRVNGLDAEWIPLANPGELEAYEEVHAAWAAARR